MAERCRRSEYWTDKLRHLPSRIGAGSATRRAAWKAEVEASGGTLSTWTTTRTKEQQRGMKIYIFAYC